MDPIILQGALSIPLVFSLAIYTCLRRDRSKLQGLASALIFCVGLWLVALLIRRMNPESQQVALLLERFSSAAMPPLFLVLMGHFSRHPSFERSHAATVAVSVPFVLFFIAFLTNDAHQLMVADTPAMLSDAHPREWAGPLFWAFHGWIFVADLIGLALCLWAWRRGRTPGERRRPLLVLSAITLPILTHLIHLGGLLPIDYTLTPGSIALGMLLFVRGIHRHGLLETQPVIRQDVIEHLPDGLVLADAEGLVLDVNVAAEATLGRSRDALRGERIEAVLDALGVGEERAGLAREIASLPLGGAPLSRELRTPDARVIDLVAGAVGAVGYQPAGRFISLQDRSAERRSEQLLRERQRLESVAILAGGVAHEVNNPLSFVRSNLAHIRVLAERLGKRAEGEAAASEDDLLELREIADESIEGVDRIGRIVASMLRFSRGSDGGRGPVDLNHVVETAMRLAAFDRSRAVRVDRSLAPDLSPVTGSEDQLVQVVLNLLRNASQALAGRDDARLVAETTREGDAVVLRVCDNGPGIPDEHRRRIFEPFFTTRPPGEGTGLGLSIALDIVREHGGTLEVDADPERGTCFAIRLPAAT